VSIWTGPNAISHLRSGADWHNVIVRETKVLTDIAANQLAQVVWVIPDGSDSDHSGVNDGSGPSWVASIVNAIGNSPYWSNTAIIITWDDWGGWYDHVAPSIYSVYEYGFRVPLIVVSPYAKKAYVSHVNHDFGSILRFIESTFALPSLDYADARADDLADCFDFTQAVIPYTPVTSKYAPAYFIDRAKTASPKDPDDD
jgi:phospholipase C